MVSQIVQNISNCQQVTACDDHSSANIVNYTLHEIDKSCGKYIVRAVQVCECAVITIVATIITNCGHILDFEFHHIILFIFFWKHKLHKLFWLDFSNIDRMDPQV